MTRDEIARLAAVCLLNYDNTSLTTDEVITAWSFSLSDVPYEAAAEALRIHIRESPFFPKPADIYQRVIDLTGALPKPGEAWEIAMRRLRDTYPGHPAPPWDAPYPVRAAVKAMGGFDALRMSERPGADRHAFVSEIYPVFRQQAARNVNIAALIAHGAEALEPGFMPKPVALPQRVVNE